MGVKILAVVFAIVALRRVISRYRKHRTLTVEFVAWTVIFGGIGVLTLVPQRTDAYARWMGVSTGFNLLAFMAILGLLFTVYRLIARVHTLERDMTSLVRGQALALTQRVPAAAVEKN
jgi:hypothetical protein